MIKLWDTFECVYLVKKYLEESNRVKEFNKNNNLYDEFIIEISDKLRNYGFFTNENIDGYYRDEIEIQCAIENLQNFINGEKNINFYFDFEEALELMNTDMNLIYAIEKVFDDYDFSQFVLTKSDDGNDYIQLSGFDMKVKINRMSEYAKLTEPSIKMGGSNLLNSFVLKNEKVCNISMASLRNYYQTDRTNFSLLAKELSLRGTKFILNKENTYFCTVFNGNNQLVISNKTYDDLKKFKNIDFGMLGLNSLINDYSIENDLFFDGTFIDGYKIFNGYINVELLKKAFVENGFEIMTYYEYSNMINTKKDILTNYDNNILIEAINTDDIIENQHVDKVGDENDNQQSKLIKNIFWENGFRKFVKYCDDNNVFLIDELTDDFVNDFINVRTVGIGKVADVKKRLNSLKNGNANINIELSSSERIDGYFVPNSKYHLFLSDCQKNGYVYMSDLTLPYIDSLINIKQMGKAKADIIKSKYIAYVGEEKYSLEIRKNKRLECESELFEKIKDLKIMEFCEKVFNKKFSSLKKVSDFYNLDFDNSFDSEEIEIFDYLFKYANHLDMNYYKDKLQFETFTKEHDKIFKDERNIDIILERLKNNKTLEEVALIYDITRERVRQIIAKTEEYCLDRKKCNIVLNFIYFIKVILIYEKSVIPLDNISNVIDNLLVIDILKNTNIISFNSLISSLLLDRSSSSFDLLVNTFVDEDKFKFGFYKLDDYYEDIKRYVVETFFNDDAYESDDEEIEELMEYFIGKFNKAFNYFEYGDYISKGKLHKSSAYYLSATEIFEGGFEISDETIEQMNEFIRTKLKTETTWLTEWDNSIRSVDAYFLKSDEFLRIESYTYIYEPYFDKTKLPNISKVVSSLLLENEKVTIYHIIDVLATFEMKDPNDYNKYEIFASIKQYLSDICSTGTTNSFDVYRNNAAKTNKTDDIQKIIDDELNTHAIINVNYLMKKMHLPKTRITQSLDRCDFIQSWDNNQYIKSEALNLSEIEKIALDKLLECELSKNGITSYNRIIDEMKFDDTLTKVIDRLSIETDTQIRSLFQHNNYDTQYYLHINSISNSKDIEDIYPIFLNSISASFSKEEFYDFYCGYYKFAKQTAVLVIKRLLDNKTLIKYGPKTYIQYKTLCLTLSDIEIIKNYVSKIFGDRKFITNNDFIGYNNVLPDKNFSWSPIIISELINMFGDYKVLEKKYTNGRGEELFILVSKNDTCNTYGQFVCEYLKKNYTGRMRKKEVGEYLMKERLHNFNTLPTDLIAENYLNEDELGFLSYNENNEIEE